MSEIFDVAVIGSGPGGYVAAIRAAQLGLKTACIEKDKNLGGTCLNVGCIPSKALLYSSEFYQSLLKEGKIHGIEAKEVRFNFKQMMLRKQTVVASFNEGVAALFKKNKVTRFHGKASLQSSTTITISNSSSIQEITARHTILATGSEPIALPFLPFDERKILSSTGALSQNKSQKRCSSSVLASSALNWALSIVDWDRKSALLNFSTGFVLHWMKVFPKNCKNFFKLKACNSLSSKVTAATCR